MSDELTRIRLPLGKRVASHVARPVPLLSYVGWCVVALIAWPIGYRWAGVWSASIAVTLTAAWAVLALFHRRRRCVELHQNGLDYHVGAKHRYLLWNQLYEVYQTPLYSAFSAKSRDTAPRQWMYRLVSRDGRSLRLHDLESLRELGMRIQEQFKHRHLPIALDAFRAGYSVRFGRHLSVSSEGMYFGSKLVTWDEISEITIDEAHEIQVTRVNESKPSFRIAASAVPNLPVLDGILRATQETEHAEDYYLDGRPTLEDDGHSSLLEHESSDLLSEGFDWEEINQVRSGQLSIDELLTRGPRYRPRRPR